MERRAELIAEMSVATWLHLACVVCAALIGAIVLLRRKGDRRHRLLGRLWVGMMAAGALSSFWIHDIFENSFSPIHLLSVWTLCSLALGLLAIRFRHRLRNGMALHAAFMMSLYATGILIAGGFTFLPHRLLGRLTFGEIFPAINYGFVAICALAGLWLLRRSFGRSNQPSD